MRKIWPLAVILVIAIAFSVNSIYADEWWNNDWENRLPIYVLEETGREHYNALIEIEFDTYLLVEDGLMQADCGDIRIVDYSDNKLLNYEVSGCDQEDTKIKFRANVPANFNGVLASIYYNNIDATSEETEISAWATKTDMKVARSALALATHNNKIYAIGGYTINQIDDNNEMFNPATSSWTTKEKVPLIVSQHAATTLGNRIYIAGGYSDGAYISSLYSYVPITNTWSSPKASMSIARGRLVLEAVDSKLYAIGGSGRTASGDSKIYSTVEEYDPSTNTWTTKTSMPTPRKNMASVVIDGEIYVIGGKTPDGTTTKVEVYNIESNEWDSDSIAEMPLGRSECKAVVLDEKIYVFSSIAKNNVYIYNIDENTWELGEDMPVSRRNFAVEEANGKIYVVGGDSELSACIGTADACSTFDGDFSGCTSQDGCSYSSMTATCGGTATACNTYDIDWKCNAQDGCSWDFVSSGQTDEYSVPNSGLNVSVILETDEVCDGFDNDADGEIDEDNVCSDIGNCGSFGNSCYTNNVANATCENGVCIIQNCEEDYFDADLDPINGCECTITNDGIEIEDGIDNDCDGIIDFPAEDLDNDGYDVNVDCDDEDSSIHPNATEYCDGIDNNCNEWIDEDCPGGGQSVLDQTLALSYTIGNGECEAGEDQEIAPIDCGCPEGLILVGNTCRDPSDDVVGYVIGDDYCDKDKGESKENSPDDCKSPAGKYVAIILTIVGIAALVYYVYERYPRKQLDSLTSEHKVSSPKASPSSLKGYVSNCLSKGFSTSQIRDALLKRGWNEDKVEEALE